MKENMGNGWVDRGPRTAVKHWDDDMGSTKAQKEIDSRMFGYSEIPVGLAHDMDELLYGSAAPHVAHPEWDE
ncbi:MAG: hypothetical protein ACXWOV_02865 [Isosphaeraceae bacterium]